MQTIRDILTIMIPILQFTLISIIVFYVGKLIYVSIKEREKNKKLKEINRLIAEADNYEDIRFFCNLYNIIKNED